MHIKENHMPTAFSGNGREEDPLGKMITALRTEDPHIAVNYVDDTTPISEPHQRGLQLELVAAVGLDNCAACGGQVVSQNGQHICLNCGQGGD
jgi:hypothetical protein